MGKIISFTGASGSGKSTIAQALGFPFVRSSTTRPPRPSDNPGEYEYMEQEDFHHEEEAWNSFIWVTTYGKNYYGTKYEPVDRALASKENSVILLVPEVLHMLLSYVGREKVLPFYIRTPEEAILRSRLEKRGEAAENIEWRLKESKDGDARAEKSNISYIFITNNGTIEEAVAQVRKYLM